MSIIYKNVMQEALDALAELHVMASEDSQSPKVGPGFREANRIVAEVWLEGFCKLHACMHPLDDVKGVYPNRVPEVKVVSATVAQLEAIIQAHKERAHGEAIQLVRHGGNLQAFVIDCEGKARSTELFNSQTNNK